ncbi:MAG: prepilin peptidase [Solirubrobacterales bacterium]
MGSQLPGEPVASALMAASLFAVLAWCTATDLRDRTVPNAALGAGTVLGLAAIASAQPGLLDDRLAAALGAGGFLLAPALLFPGSMGLGDVKLAAMLGLFLGPAMVTALLAAFLAGTLAGLLLFARHGTAARKMTIPFVPYLALGAGLALLL